MKAKNCIKGVKVKTKVETNELYHIGFHTKIRHKVPFDIRRGTLGVVLSKQPDLDDDCYVKFENGLEVFINVKCLCKVKE